MDTLGSQASQDLFVSGILSYPSTGWYLEIGAGHPKNLSNTYLLELMGWKGFSVDNGNYECYGGGKIWAENRENPLFNVNACDFKYADMFYKLNFPSIIDYLSLDIDEASNMALKIIPLDKFKFKVITIEHDSYRLGDLLKPEQRNILEKDYIRLCSDVCFGGFPYEDWYLSKSLYQNQLILEKTEHSVIIEKYKFETNRDKILSKVN